MTEPVAEVSVSAPCEHGSFTVQVGSPGVWLLPGVGRIETEADEVFVFHQGPDLCPCWEYEEER